MSRRTVTGTLARHVANSMHTCLLGGRHDSQCSKIAVHAAPLGQTTLSLRMLPATSSWAANVSAHADLTLNTYMISQQGSV